MTEKKIFIIVGLVIILFVSCSPSPQAIETAIAQTDEALPTNTLEPTATITKEPTATATKRPSLTPKPETGNLAGISRSSFVDIELLEKLDMSCEDSVTDNGLNVTTCRVFNAEENLCSLIEITVGGFGKDTVDLLAVVALAYTFIDESHNDCKNVLYEIARIPYNGSTPDEVEQWVKDNIDGLTPGNETKIDMDKTFTGINFKLTVDSGAYSLFIK